MLNSGHLSSSSVTRASMNNDRGKKQNCELCGEKFNMFQREHCCKRCSRAVCSNCSKSKKKIIGYSTKPDKEHRICTNCKKESDNLEALVRDNNMKFGSDSLIGNSWVDSLGLSSRATEIQSKFDEMKIATPQLKENQPFKYMEMSIGMQSYTKNFDLNYSFVEMLAYTQNGCTTPPEQIITDTVTAFLSVHHERVGFSDELLNLTVFLLCFSSPAKVFCLLSRIYKGDMIPQQLFPKADGDHLDLHKSKHRVEIYGQIVKLLKDRFKCEPVQLTQMQKYLEEKGMRSIESMLVGYLNFETSFSIFDSIFISSTPSKYTQIIRVVTTFIFLNRESISRKSNDASFNIEKDILDRTSKDDLMLGIKWTMPDIPIPAFEDKLKDLQAAHAILQRNADGFTTKIIELNTKNESLKKEIEQIREDNLKQIESKQRQISEINAAHEETKAREKNLEQQLIDSKKSIEEFTSESSSLGLKHAKVESDKADLEARLKVLQSELSSAQLKNQEQLSELLTQKDVATRANAESKKLATSYAQLEAELSLSRSNFAKELSAIRDEQAKQKQDSNTHYIKCLDLESQLKASKAETEAKLAEAAIQFELKLTDSKSNNDKLMKEKENQISQLNSKIEKLNVDLKQSNEDTETERKKVEKSSEQIIAIEAKIVGLNSALALEQEHHKQILSETKAEHQKSLVALQEKQSTEKKSFDEKIAQVGQQLAESKELQSKYESDLNSVRSEISNLEAASKKEKSNHQEQLGKLEATLGKEREFNKSNSNRFERELNESKSEITALKKAKDELDLALEESQAKIEGYQAQIKVIEEQQALKIEEEKLAVSENTNSNNNNNNNNNNNEQSASENSERVFRLNARIETLQKEVQTASAFRETANANASNAAKKYKKLEEDSSAEIASLKQAVKQLEESKNAVIASLDSAQTQLATLEEEINELDALKEKSASKLAQVESQLAESKKKSQESSQTNVLLQEQCEGLKKQINAITIEKDEASKAMAQLSETIQEQRSKFDENMSKILAEKTELQAALASAESRFQTANGASIAANEKVTLLTENISKITEKSTELSAKCEEYTKNIAMLKGASESANQRAQAEIERITVDHGKAKLAQQQVNDKLQIEKNQLLARIEAAEKKLQEQIASTEAIVAEKIAEQSHLSVKSEFERNSILEEVASLRVQNEKYLLRIVEGENKLEEIQLLKIKLLENLDLASQTNSTLQAQLTEKQEKIIELSNELEMKELQGETAEIVELKTKLVSMNDLQETIKMKLEENTNLQSMIRSMSQHQSSAGNSDSAGNQIVIKRLKEENEILVKSKQAMHLRMRKFAVSNLVKMYKIKELKKEQTQIQVENKANIRSNLKQNESSSEKEKMLLANLERNQSQIMMLTEENSDWIVRMKKAETMLSTTTAQLKVALSKIYLMSLECERLSDICSETGH